ncbi:MAG: hypothetical protein LBC68_12160 [Prevotellaceae bacterium]|jgi:hypothetical protein|nr:hypothetical protein [Prevotellaceae bacterium]
MKKALFIIIIGLFIVSCGRKVTCEQFPKGFIEKYIPYEKNQKVVFATDPLLCEGLVDTMNFIVTEVYFWESYNYKLNSDVDCDGYCEPIYVKMIDTTKNIVLEYQIRAFDNFVWFDINIDDVHFNSQIVGTPQYFNWYMNAIPFERNTNTGFYICYVVDYLGIEYLEKKVSEEHYICWFLVRGNKQQVKYISAKQKGCL